MGIQVDIIQANDDMCNELAKIKRQVWESTYRGIYPESKFNNFNIENETEKFLNMINNPDIQMFVAIIEDRIIGYMAIGKSPRRPNEEREEIVLLYVLKDYQGMGVGKQFFNIATEKLKKDSNDYFVVYCNKYNQKAQNFYKRMGCEILSIDEDNTDKSLPQIKFIYRY